MKKIAITVGQFIHRKGFDVLLNAWARCNKEYELYIIGAEPTKEYLDFKEKLHLDNVHFEGFKTKVLLSGGGLVRFSHKRGHLGACGE